MVAGSLAGDRGLGGGVTGGVLNTISSNKGSDSAVGVAWTLLLAALGSLLGLGLGFGFGGAGTLPDWVLGRVWVRSQLAENVGCDLKK